MAFQHPSLMLAFWLSLLWTLYIIVGTLLYSNITKYNGSSNCTIFPSLIALRTHQTDLLPDLDVICHEICPAGHALLSEAGKQPFKSSQTPCQ